MHCSGERLVTHRNARVGRRPLLRRDVLHVTTSRTPRGPDDELLAGTLSRADLGSTRLAAGELSG